VAQNLLAADGSMSVVMKKIEWNRVTWYSKLLAVAVFLATFGIAFCLGAQWGALGGTDREGRWEHARTGAVL